MEPQAYINREVAAGKDIVFGEHHDSFESTMGMLEETVRQNPGRIQAVSVEFSPRLQPYIDQVASGTLGVEDFTRLCRISNEQEYMEIGGALHAQGRLSDDQYDRLVRFSENTIQAVLGGTNNADYPPQRQAIDVSTYGALYSLVRTAAEKGVPVIASDLGREALPLNVLDTMTVADLIDRMDDTSDGNLLAGRVDLNSPQSILVHRGAFHLWDLTSERDPSVSNAGKGMDDYLEAHGRHVVVIGNYESTDVLSGEVDSLRKDHVSVRDPSDVTIINGQLVEQPDQDIAERGIAPVSPGGLAPK